MATPQSVEKSAIEAASVGGYKLVNWPPSRGEKPPEMRWKVSRRWTRPKIEALPDGEIERREAEREGQPRISLALWAPVTSVARLSARDASEVIHGLDEVGLRSSLPVETYEIFIPYPLGTTARIVVSPYALREVRESDGEVRETKHMDVGYVLLMVARAYRQIYLEHEKWGVWGHEIGDLTFERLNVYGGVDGAHNEIVVGVGS